MHSILLWTLCVVGLLRTAITVPISDSKGNEDDKLDGSSLLNLGRFFNKPMLRLVGKTFIKSEENIEKLEADIREDLCRMRSCTMWSDWTACSSKQPGKVGIMTRSRSCGVNTIICSSSTESNTTETDTNLCEGCPEGYNLTRAGFCLKYVSTTMIKSDAEATCQKDNGHIVNINSKVKSDDVHSVLESFKFTANIWIDGQRTDSSSPWEHVYEAPLSSFSNWLSGQPGASDTCKMDYYSSSGVWYWIGVPCTAKRYFVCEVTN